MRGPGTGRSLGLAQGRWVGHRHLQKTLTHLEGPARSLEDSPAADPLTLGPRPCPQSMGTPRVPARTVLFQRERTGLTYRVPALLSVPPGPTLLAFAEQRLSPDDAHAHRLVQRTGTLAGGSVRVSALGGEFRGRADGRTWD